ncbi:peptide-methionine (S)-S-oxide reductase MsrA [Rhodococcus sp. D2-41]|uniref:Peptide methionine sulfoxide reductase MsrA n=1 Tax=Speluncibacter jeojiensis TaxID=2710754 RepID=A0A9X4LXS4_9ACTN|nr:peptide-methionine (S)-S-oxide reductase MsrA [Rhodococcus sp. D2-41]MDG3010511.1 peptide-methionine (S)-S-oxide reductase MsrA [Rhodococcus sp. D2-41]MDG3014259.1 peptide-methionine (S)-S-oxide reductase MsrA [Corynebacteriales bacterium D3-21]
MSWMDDLMGRAGPRTAMVDAERALPGRDDPMPVPQTHDVSGARMTPPFPEGTEVAVLGLGCFWGVEREFWELDGVYTTASGYAGGYTPNPTYEEVCSGQTGHAEVVQVVFDPKVLDYRALLAHFWENHDPTQGYRQGNDVGTQYRSIILTIGDEQARVARETAELFGKRLAANGYSGITTEIGPLESTGAGRFFYAEPYHQQYLAKNPGGYCPIHATGIKCG